MLIYKRFKNILVTHTHTYDTANFTQVADMITLF